MFAATTSRALQCLGRPVGRRLLLQPGKFHKCQRLLTSKIDQVVGGKLDKEFPGYFDKEHHKTHHPGEPALDLHNRLKDLDQEEEAKPHQLSCKEVVDILESHQCVDECVVIDINVKQNGEIPVAFVVKKPGTDRACTSDTELHKQLVDSLRATLGPTHKELEHDLIRKLDTILTDDKIKDDLIRDELVEFVRQRAGPYAILKVVIVDALPKTTSGKILRGTLYDIARGMPYSITPRIEDTEVLNKLEKEIKSLLGSQYGDD